MSALDDQAAVERVLAGDISAFEHLSFSRSPLAVSAHQPCLPLLPRPRTRRGNGAGSFPSRLPRARTMAQGCRLLHLALRAGNKLLSFGAAPPPAPSVSIDDVREPMDPRAIDGGLEDHDRDLAVRHAVVALPAKYREALILFYFHEMNVPAARAVSACRGTFKARLFRGREILRGKLHNCWRCLG